MATILIVDDHAINRQFLMTLLGYGGHRLLEAAEGATALALVRAEQPDLVITDILMPNMDGYEFVTHMRAHPSLAKTPVIFYTASYRASEARSMAQTCGVQWVLSKPSEPELILKTVQEALGAVVGPDLMPTQHLTASLEAEKFSVLDAQLTELISKLGPDGATELQDEKSRQNEPPEAQRSALNAIALKMAATLGSLQQVSLRLTRLVDLGLDLAAERDPGRLLEILCRAAQGVCDAKYAAVAVLTDNGKSLGYCYTRSMESEMVARLRALPPHSGVLGRLLALNTPTRMNGLEGSPEILGLPASHPPVHAFLGVPLSSKEVTYGWLYLVDKVEASEFSEVDEQVAATIASQMAAAYENLLLYDEIDQHRAQLQMEVVERKQAQEALRKNLLARTVMAECNRVLVHADDEMTLLKEMCLTIAETGGYALVSIWDRSHQVNHQTTTSTGPSLKLVAQAGMLHQQPGLFGMPWIESAQGRYPTERVLSSGQSFMLGEHGTANEKWAEAAAAQGFRSVLSLPLTEGGKIYGALTIYAVEPHAFLKEQLDMFEQLAGDIAYGTVSMRTRRARDLAEERLVAAQQKLTDILGSIDNIVWSVSDTEFLYISPVAEKVFGYPLAEFYKSKNRWFDSIHPADQVQVRETMMTLHQTGSVNHEYRIVRGDGHLRWLEERSKAILDPQGKLLRVDGVASDITERKAYQERIEHLATHDPLTALANRNLLQDRLMLAMAQARRSNHLLALLFLDLDRFKDINDQYGHAAGDALLVAIAARLQSVVREGDTVARPGGDEFIILLTDIADLTGIHNIARKMLQVFAVPFRINDIELTVTASMGISVYPNDGEDIEALLVHTDAAMYRAKEGGGNALQYFGVEAKAETNP